MLAESDIELQDLGRIGSQVIQKNSLQRSFIQLNIRKPDSQIVSFSSSNNINDPYPAHADEILMFSSPKIDNRERNDNDNSVNIIIDERKSEKEEKQKEILKTRKKSLISVKKNQSCSNMPQNFSNKQKEQSSGVLIDATSAIMSKAKAFKRAVELFLSHSSVRRFQKLQQFHFDLIKDKSYFQSTNIVKTQSEKDKKHQTITKNKNWSYFSQIISNILHIKVFSPDYLIIQIFDFLIALILIYLIMRAPMYFVFGEFMDPILILIDYCCAFCLVLNPIVNLNKAVYIEGNLILEKNLIVRNYLVTNFSSFLTELFSIISILLGWRIGYLVCALRLKDIRRMFSQVDEKYHIQLRYFTITQLGSLLSLVLVVGHYCGCGFYFIASIQPDETPTWLSVYNKGKTNDLDWFDNYINSIYFSFITMITVGYGDITPVSISEKIYTILITIGSCAIFAYAVNIIGGIFQKRTHEEADYKQKKYSILRFLQERDIGIANQTKVLKLFQYSYGKQQENKINQNGELILRSMSKGIQSEIYKEFFQRILKDIPLINQNFSPAFIQRLPSAMKDFSLGPGEQLIRAGDSERDLYYIYKGRLEYYQTNDMQEEKILGYEEKTGIVGIGGFFGGQKRNVNVRSQEVSHIIEINFNAFNSLLRSEFQFDYEKFCELKEEFTIKNSTLGTKCKSCQKLNHNANQCELLHYIPKKVNIVAKEVYNNRQERNSEFKRRKKDKKMFNALLRNDDFRIQGKAIKLDILLYIYEEQQRQDKIQEIHYLFPSLDECNDMQYAMNLPYISCPNNQDIDAYSEDPFFDDMDYRDFEEFYFDQNEKISQQGDEQELSIANALEPVSNCSIKLIQKKVEKSSNFANPDMSNQIDAHCSQSKLQEQIQENNQQNDDQKSQKVENFTSLSDLIQWNQSICKEDKASEEKPQLEDKMDSIRNRKHSFEFDIIQKLKIIEQMLSQQNQQNNRPNQSLQLLEPIQEENEKQCYMQLIPIDQKQQQQQQSTPSSKLESIKRIKSEKCTSLRNLSLKNKRKENIKPNSIRKIQLMKDQVQTPQQQDQQKKNSYQSANPQFPKQSDFSKNFQKQEQEQFMVVPDFDARKIYKLFYPSQNYDLILKNIRAKQKNFNLLRRKSNRFNQFKSSDFNSKANNASGLNQISNQTLVLNRSFTMNANKYASPIQQPVNMNQALQSSLKKRASIRITNSQNLE